MMLTETERLRFNLLQERKQNNTLSDAEQTEWQCYVRQIEAEEAVYLRPATARINQENAEMEAQNRELKALIQRKKRLAQRLDRVLALSNSEREAINTELARVLAASASHAGSLQ